MYVIDDEPIEIQNARLHSENAELLSDNQMLLTIVHQLWPLRRYVSIADPIREIPIELTRRGIVYVAKREGRKDGLS